jgi:hypothetical protein
MNKIMLRIPVLILILLSLFPVLFIGCGNKNSLPGETQTEITGHITSHAQPRITEPAVNESESAPANPIFSHEGGLYTTEIALELSVPADTAGVNAIRYTVNGDEPVSSSPKYDKPVVLLASRESVVIRAACFSRGGAILGNIITNTYIKAADGRQANFIVSISADDNDLNGSKGIITHPAMSGKEWERPAHIEIINGDGIRVINQDAGLRIFGGSSRVLPQKSFRIVTRKTEYFNDTRYNGKGNFDYAFFENLNDINGGQFTAYDRIVLRNGGNDSLQSTAADPLRMNLMRDGVANNYALHTAPAVTNQLSAPAVIYLNGKYYGILDFKPDINDDYIKNIYGLADKSAIAVIKSELDTTRHCDQHSDGGACRFDDVWFFYAMDEGADSEIDDFTALCRRAITSTPENRAAVYGEVSSKIDLDNFMQYCALNLFACNTDWPHNNIRLWRYTGEPDPQIPESDGRWRFTLRDMDFSFGRYSDLVLPEIYTLADTDTFTRVLGNYRTGTYTFDRDSGYYPDSLLLQGLLDFCLKNDGFRSAFDAQCRALVSAGNIDLLKALMQEYIDGLYHEMPAHLERWQGTIDGRYDFENWLTAGADMLVWVEERPAYFIAHLEAALAYYR